MSDHKALARLLADAALISVTAEEREEQRRSFAHGNVSMSNPEVTREMIDKAADELATEALARRLVAHERWEYRPGITIMATEGWDLLLYKPGEGLKGAGWFECRYDQFVPTNEDGSFRPPIVNLTDHATHGCLLGMLDEATGGYLSVGRGVAPKMDGRVWVVNHSGQRGGPSKRFKCRGEALARALLAAWEVPREETPEREETPA